MISSPSSATRGRREAGASRYSADLVFSSDDRKYRVSTMTMKPLPSAESTATPSPTTPPKTVPANSPRVT